MGEIAHDKSATEHYRQLFNECTADLTSCKEMHDLQGRFDILAGKTTEGEWVKIHFKRCREAITGQLLELANTTLPGLNLKLDRVDTNVENQSDENGKKADGVNVAF
ncbi:hypothetical protein SAMN05421805_12529 [Saccharopolyspora antimicrobica]|uniref:Uncharacterized protein n=1 Tax=Saccharopolyspora antimicrobica TaxID=455193 RepID=A0A1I5K318_9PSEU|nr:hypothetical protein [Saccharopolyspora antimicrobica]RKT84769.1 hypothetical protein ATL45_3094 [Saccharopolyspora antimicrobica]SFO79407.1 hypothetical protein SAMN05421805_12529 [Saccharopolyspora antimicrobica]